MVGVTWVSDLIVCFCMGVFVCEFEFHGHCCVVVSCVWLVLFWWWGVLFGRFSGFSLGVLACDLF